MLYLKYINLSILLIWVSHLDGVSVARSSRSAVPNLSLSPNALGVWVVLVDVGDFVLVAHLPRHGVLYCPIQTRLQSPNLLPLQQYLSPQLL